MIGLPLAVAVLGFPQVMVPSLSHAFPFDRVVRRIGEFIRVEHMRQPEVVPELVGMVWRIGRTGIDTGFRNVVCDRGEARVRLGSRRAEVWRISNEIADFLSLMGSCLGLGRPDRRR